MGTTGTRRRRIETMRQWAINITKKRPDEVFEIKGFIAKFALENFMTERGARDLFNTFLNAGEFIIENGENFHYDWRRIKDDDSEK